MVTKVQKKLPSQTELPTPTVKVSAQQIWQADLGAFTRAQAEGTKAFKVPVKEYISMQHKTQETAEKKLAVATRKMTTIATGLSDKAGGALGIGRGIAHCGQAAYTCHTTPCRDYCHCRQSSVKVKTSAHIY